MRFSVLLCADNSCAALGWPEYNGRAFVKPAGDGLLYVWGVLKGTHGEGATHPVPEYELQGWAVRTECLAMGASHVALSAENSAVAWAQMPVAYGQLGYGASGPKSSHKPQKVKALDGCAAAQVVAAVGSTHYLVDATNALVKKLKVWEPPDASPDDPDQGKPPAKGRKKAAPAAKKPAAKKRKA